MLQLEVEVPRTPYPDRHVLLALGSSDWTKSLNLPCILAHLLQCCASSALLRPSRFRLLLPPAIPQYLDSMNCTAATLDHIDRWDIAVWVGQGWKEGVTLRSTTSATGCSRPVNPAGVQTALPGGFRASSNPKEDCDCVAASISSYVPRLDVSVLFPFTLENCLQCS